MDRRTLASGALAPLATLWILAAASSATAAPRLVVNATGADGAAALETVRRGLGADYAADVATPAELLDQGFDSWLITWPGRLDACEGAPAPLAGFEQTLAKAEQLMMDLEYGEAQVLLEGLDGRLCAASEPLPRSMVSRVPYLLGMVLAYRGETDRAREAFQRAVHRQPDLVWDEDFPPDPQQLFLAAATDAVRGVGATIVLAAPPGTVDVWIDGNELPTDDEGLALLGDRHLLQLRGSDGALRGAILTVEQDADLSLLTVDEVLDTLDRDPKAARGQRAFQALAATALKKGYGEIVVVHSVDATTAWRFDEIDHSWAQVSLVLEQQLAKGRRLQGAGSALLGVGGAVAVVGAVIAGASTSRGNETRESMNGASGQMSAGLYDLYIDEYEGHRRDATAGTVMLGVGAAIAGVGLPVLIKGTQESRKGAAQASVGGLVAPGSVVLAIHGRF